MMLTQQVDLSIELVEKSLLGSMLRENYLITDSNVNANFFTTQIHRTIFTAMQELIQSGKSVDYITLLTAREPVELGGANYIADLKNVDRLIAAAGGFNRLKVMSISDGEAESEVEALQVHAEV